MKGKSCQDKTRHTTVAHAQEHLDRIRPKENRKLANRLNVYACIHCGGYHVGHDRNKGRAKRYRGEPV